jgi:hypothetical protein
MVNLDVQNQQAIRGAGYGITFVGLSSHQMPLYLHKDKLSDKVLGDLFMKYTIQNPKLGPNNAEFQYLARKGEAGLFAWEPGEACLGKKFERVEYVSDLIGGGTRVLRHEPDMGCRWCRTRAEVASTRHEAGAVDSSGTEPVMEDVSAPPIALQCEQCRYDPKLKNKRGKLFSPKQRAAQLRAHIRSAH